MYQRPYLKKYGRAASFAVWIVDGKYIRTHVDEEFTNFGQHFRFPFIPKSEFWIDKEHGAGEEEFFIDHLLVENRLMAAGMKYDQAIARADRIERKERHKTRLVRRLTGLDRKHLLRRIHKTLLRKYSRAVRVWIVRGDYVRDLYFIDFTEGGHDFVYHFVPEKEVWLDDDLSAKERRFVLLHELHERALMAKGWNYGRAHRDSSRVEYFCRSHPEKLERMLQEELKKNS
jgi:hypothetical protein